MRLDTECSWMHASTPWNVKTLQKAAQSAADFEKGTFRWLTCTPPKGQHVSGVCHRIGSGGERGLDFVFIKDLDTVLGQPK